MATSALRPIGLSPIRSRTRLVYQRLRKIGLGIGQPYEPARPLQELVPEIEQAERTASQARGRRTSRLSWA
jgi:hypothetical protein